MERFGEAGCEGTEIATCEGIEATEDVCGRMITLGFYHNGVALLLTYDEALALGRVLWKMAQATRLHVGGANGYRS